MALTMKNHSACLLCVFLLLSSLAWSQPEVFHLREQRMGAAFIYSVVAQDSVTAHQINSLADAEVLRIEQLISSWIPGSQTTWINQAAGKEPVHVDQAMYQLISRCLRISTLTGGAFDPTYAGMLPLWRFDGTMQQLPDSQLVAATARLVDYRKILLNPADQTVFLADSGMKIGFGGIGKGYAADRAKTIMQDLGALSGVVNAGGDLVCWGTGPDGTPWQISIADPVHPDRIIATIPVKDMAVVTSGNYERYADIDGQRYSHILDPRTGWPLQGLKSVTVFAPIGEFADGLATALFVLREEQGMNLVEDLQGVECLMITEDLRILSSSGLRMNPGTSGTAPDVIYKIGNR